MSGRDGAKTKNAGEKPTGEKHESKGSCGTKACDKGCGAGKKDAKK